MSQELKESIRVIVADDEQLIRKKIVKILSEIPDVEIVAEVGDGNQLIEQCLLHEPDAVFVDVGMPELDGFTAVSQIVNDLPNLFVVFTTAYTDYAVGAFELPASDYIVKPIEKKRILRSVGKIRKHLLDREATLLKVIHSAQRPDKLIIKTQGELLVIDPKTILYLEKEKKKTLVHTVQEIYETSDTISKLENKLNPRDFYQSHKGFVVNIHKIQRITPWADRSYLIRFEGSNKEAMLSRGRLEGLYELLGTTKD